MQLRSALASAGLFRTAFFAAVILLQMVMPAIGDGRIALVVGVGAYVNAPALRNTTNDASAIGAALKRLGFDADIVLDPNKTALDAAIRRFGERAAGADVALFYYAGHALESGGKNWIVPTSAAISKTRDLPYETSDVDVLLDQLDGAARLAVIILDACRDNPFRTRIGDGRGLGSPAGLAQLRAGAGTLIEFATAPGTLAADGTGTHSPFTAALLHQVEIPGQEVHKTFAEVRREVREATHGRQTPWEASAMEGDFFFKPLLVAPSKPVATAMASPPHELGGGLTRSTSDEAELLFWKSIVDSNDAADFNEYLAKFPKGLFAGVAANRIRKMESATSTQPSASKAAAAPQAQVVQPTLSAQSGEHREEVDNDTLKFRLLTELTSLSESVRIRRVSDYLGAKSHRMFAMLPDRSSTYYSGGWGNTEQAERVGLEQCELSYRSACVLLSVDQSFVGTLGQLGRTQRTMPRVHYSGLFDPAQIPAIPESVRGLPNVFSYGSTIGAKAIALNANKARIYAAGGINDQLSAERKALNDCYDDPDRFTGDTCLLYAIGNTVVLPDFRSDPTDADVAYKRIEEALARAAPRIASNSISFYARQTEPKAIAVHIESAQVFAVWGNYVDFRISAETEALEGCQHTYGSPCVLLATGTELKSADPASAPKRDMPRLHVSGLFDSGSVPFVTLRTAPELRTYLSLSSAKAIAIRALHTKLSIASGAKTVEEAEQKALSTCNASEPEYPCFIYASGDKVVFPARKTEAAKPGR